MNQKDFVIFNLPNPSYYIKDIKFPLIINSSNINKFIGKNNEDHDWENMFI